TCWLWDLTADRPIGDQLGASGRVSTAAFSPDGKTVLAASGASLYRYDATTGKALGESRLDFGRGGPHLFSPDGGTLVWRKINKKQLGDVATGNPLPEPFPASPSTLNADSDYVVFSPDGKRMASKAGKPSRPDAPKEPDEV